MASNYTENYQLPLWAADDSFLRAEFNDANQKIDDVLGTIPKVVTGTYGGDETANRSIALGFRPKFVLLMGYSGNYFFGILTEYVFWYVYRTSLYYSSPGQDFQITENGFQIINDAFNMENYEYHYVAIG